MTNDERTEVMDRIFREVTFQLSTKSQDYSSKEDANLNFKRNAEALGMTPFQIWAVYASKHWDSIINAIKRNPHMPETVTEPLVGRIADEIAYLVILESLLEEQKKTKVDVNPQGTWPE